VVLSLIAMFVAVSIVGMGVGSLCELTRSRSFLQLLFLVRVVCGRFVERASCENQKCEPVRCEPREQSELT
jgi:hypothetical protein